MKFNINYENALKLQKRISKKKHHMTEVTDITIRVREDSRTDLFATNGQIMGAYFTNENIDQQEMDLPIYSEEKVFTVDLRPLDKIKKMITGSEYVSCELKENMLRVKLNNFGEEIKVRTDDNNIFDKFLDILDYDNYTSDFTGETIINTELLDKVAFGESVRLQRSIDDNQRFLVTDTDYNYRGVILGQSVIADEEPEETQDEELPFDDSLQGQADRIKLKNIQKGNYTSENLKDLNKIAENLANDPYIKKTTSYKS
ncbi:MAG TPA: hypothetical protein DCL21_05680 [Alphaproteobacteria bacterium]|nr:hypothetical protein [Alphaproteobacteria bacterium]